jgi:lipoprotein NlpD
VVGLAGCASSGSNRAPVEDRKPQPRVGGCATGRSAAPCPAAAADTRLLPGAENAGKPGFHTVKAGDSLIRIALENGQNWRDVQRWNASTTRT